MNSTSKKVYLLVIALITIIAIIVGSLRWFVFTEIGFGSKKTIDEDLASFSSIEVDGDQCGIEIKTGNEYRIEHKGKASDEPKYIVTDGKLYVEARGSRRTHFNLFGLNSRNVTTITIPRNVELDSVTVSSNAGGVDLKKVKIKNFKINVSAGGVNLKKCDFDTLIVDCAAGGIEIDNCSFNSADLRVDAGGIEIETIRPLSDYSLDLACEMGGIVLNGKDVKDSIQTNADTGLSLKASCTAGGIEIDYDR